MLILFDENTEIKTNINTASTKTSLYKYYIHIILYKTIIKTLLLTVLCIFIILIIIR